MRPVAICSAVCFAVSRTPSHALRVRSLVRGRCWHHSSCATKCTHSHLGISPRELRRPHHRGRKCGVPSRLAPFSTLRSALASADAPSVHSVWPRFLALAQEGSAACCRWSFLVVRPNGAPDQIPINQMESVVAVGSSRDSVFNVVGAHVHNGGTKDNHPAGEAKHNVSL